MIHETTPAMTTTITGLTRGITIHVTTIPATTIPATETTTSPARS
jgi:hypothetical protein